MQLVLLFCDPVEHVLSTFWSTHLFNIATWESVYSVFPVSTFGRRQMGVISSHRASELLSYDKYVLRGFVRATHRQLKSLVEFSGYRRIGDKYCYRVTFPGAPLQLDSQLQKFCFRFGKDGIQLVRGIESSDSEVE